jgi:hypothetical protein
MLNKNQSNKNIPGSTQQQQHFPSIVFQYASKLSSCSGKVKEETTVRQHSVISIITVEKIALRKIKKHVYNQPKIKGIDDTIQKFYDLVKVSRAELEAINLMI